MPEEQSMRKLRASIAAQTRWLRVRGDDREKATRPARSAFNHQIIQEIDPDGTMPDDELAARLSEARRLHYQKMAYARWHGKKRGRKTTPTPAKMCPDCNGTGRIKA